MPSMTTCIIVDDEPLARQLIESYIALVPGIQLLGSYSTVLEAFGGLHDQKVDVIFLDIEMPGISGLSFIRSLKTPPKVIFITAYTEYAVDAFEIEAIDYLVKPVTFERFLKAVQRIKNESLLEATTPKINDIFLKVDRRLIKIPLSDILYAEGLGDYLKVHTSSQTYVTYMTMGKLESLLPASKFIRIHRSTIVNTSFIKYIEGNFVKLNDLELSIGQTYKENLLKKLG
jgi:DNA-binding LytR/AlgR family response regulator